MLDLRARRPLLFARSARTTRLLASNTKLFTTAALQARFGADARLETKLWPIGRRIGERERVLRGHLALVGAGDPAFGHGDVAELAADAGRAGIARVRGDLIADDTVFDRRRSVPMTGITGGPWFCPLSGLSYERGRGGPGCAADPALVAGRALADELDEAGIRVEGELRVADTPNRIRDRRPLGLVHSPTVGSLIAATNKPSDNFLAEMLLKRLAAHPDGGGTTAAGARRAKRFANRLGSGVAMENGSGLSRLDRSTPRNVGRLLVAMARRRGGPAFRGSLPLAGREGTLADRMGGTAAAGRCRAKTGTLSDVSALSGYCRSGRGLVAFSILVNGVSDLERARDAQDRMAALIAAYGR